MRIYITGKEIFYLITNLYSEKYNSIQTISFLPSLFDYFLLFLSSPSLFDEDVSQIYSKYRECHLISCYHIFPSFIVLNIFSDNLPFVNTPPQVSMYRSNIPNLVNTS
jgi:hypothetical protein